MEDEWRRIEERTGTPWCVGEIWFSLFTGSSHVLLQAPLGNSQAVLLYRPSHLWLYITVQLVSPWLPHHHAHHCFTDT